MHARMWLVALALAFSAGRTQHRTETQFGSVGGTVLDDKGVPVSDARVYDEPIGTVRIGKDHFVLTDQAGRFLLEDVPVGKTMVIAIKTEAGYPDSRYAVYTSNEVLPIVQVQAAHTTSPVVVKLPAKGGVLTGEIVNSRSHLPVPNSRIALSRVDHQGWFIETDPEGDGSFAFTIPSKPFHLQVSARGFKTWMYEESKYSKNHSPLIIGSERKVRVTIYLDPLN